MPSSVQPSQRPWLLLENLRDLWQHVSDVGIIFRESQKAFMWLANSVRIVREWSRWLEIDNSGTLSYAPVTPRKPIPDWQQTEQNSFNNFYLEMISLIQMCIGLQNHKYPPNACHKFKWLITITHVMKSLFKCLLRNNLSYLCSKGLTLRFFRQGRRSWILARLRVRDVTFFVHFSYIVPLENKLKVLAIETTCII